MENEKLFELMTEMYSDLKKGQDELRKGQDDLRKGQYDLKNELKSHGARLDSIDNTTRKMDIKIEELDKKVDLSLEGHKTNTDQLNRIEQEVAQHEEFILKRVK